MPSASKKKSLPVISIKKKPKPVFEERENLVSILRNEKAFRIQVFSFESIEIFEQFLLSKNIKFIKGFTSKALSKNEIHLLLNDGSSVLNAPRIILYSNMRDFTFIPYKFILSNDEKGSFVKNRFVLKSSSESYSATSLSSNDLDVAGFTADSLNYVQSVIILCMIKECKLKSICKEVQQVDPELRNMFVIKSELNLLCRYKFCTKTGESYKLNISHETVVKVCEKLGFYNVFG
ncbi:uncharacterized protein VICG_00834 [Vittaforma corneae ATCC 50505]|uniref:Uncharacterized protein n=1 Tax=Vittaforma corneae (strain ATCC 50505) TaxID=993615 RepID=L2GMZ2_VITCO|nr:uncharacterized protein VICG_00834 [Vittaforma corneae ATCC 50505]ELA42191.1 hypothetical protein VICG_00834 [Vittaforma corneae ATCC 50505]